MTGEPLAGQTDPTRTGSPRPSPSSTAWPRLGQRAGPQLLVLAAFVLVVAAAGWVGLAVWIGPLRATAIVVGLVLAVVFVRRPELGLALFFNGQVYYFYAMFKLGLTPSTSITGAFYALLVFPALIGMLTVRKRTFKICAIDVAVVLLMTWMLLSYLLFSYGSAWGLKKLEYAPVLALGPFLAFRLMDRATFSRFVKYVLALSKVLAVVFLYELVTSFGSQFRFALMTFGPEQIDNPILIGITFTIPLLILYVQMIEGRQKPTPVNVVWIIVFALLSLRAGSRGALVALVVTIFLYHSLKRLKAKHLLALLLFGFLVYVLFALLPEATRTFYLKVFQVNTLTPDPTNSGTQRLFLWQLAWSKFVESPVFGKGFGQFSSWATMYGFSGDTFAHNIFLESAAELGIIGLGLVIYIVFATLARAYRLYPKLHSGDDTSMLGLCFALFAFALIEAQFSGHLTNQAYLYATLGAIWGLFGVFASSATATRVLRH
jgi:O-antigen ligase